MCTKGRGKLIGAFLEQMLAACAYRGDCLGLLAIHLILILLSINKADQELQGSAHILVSLSWGLKEGQGSAPTLCANEMQNTQIF